MGRLAVVFSGLCALAWWAGAVQAAVYYVDFAAGDDAAAGTAAEAAWKHAPGDLNAQGNPAKADLKPADTVRFKGGVIYRGSVVCKWSGEEGKPITFDGNTDGKWGQGRAVIDGSEVVTGWAACSGPDEARGNPQWAMIYWALLPKGVQPGTANLVKGEKLLWMAQSPAQPDPFYMDKIDHFYTIPNKNMTTSSIIDPERLNQKDEHYWDDAQVVVWVQPNVTEKRAIRQFIPAENKIIYDKTGGEPYRDRPGRYAIYNSVQVIARPGDFVVRDTAEPDGRVKAFLLPFDQKDLAAGQVTVSVRTVGFDVVDGAGHVTIAGFRIQKFSGSARADGVGVRCRPGEVNKTTRNLVVRNNEIRWLRHAARGYGGINLYGGRDCLIEGNRILESPLSMGILIQGETNIITRNNLVRKAGGQSIWYMGVKGGEIRGNEVRDGQGTHANGISVYAGCQDILVVGNKVFDSNIAITVEQSSNVTLACNICYTPAFYVVADWGKTTGLKIYNNTLIRNDDLPSISLAGPGDVRNNIAKAYAAEAGLKPDAKHNILCNQAQLAELLVDPAKEDYRLKPGSPAIDAGEDLGLKEDIVGTKIPQGKAPDIGAYEYVPQK